MTDALSLQITFNGAAAVYLCREATEAKFADPADFLGHRISDAIEGGVDTTRGTDPNRAAARVEKLTFIYAGEVQNLDTVQTMICDVDLNEPALRKLDEYGLGMPGATREGTLQARLSEWLRGQMPGWDYDGCEVVRVAPPRNITPSV